MPSTYLVPYFSLPIYLPALFFLKKRAGWRMDWCVRVTMPSTSLVPYSSLYIYLLSVSMYFLKKRVGWRMDWCVRVTMPSTSLVPYPSLYISLGLYFFFEEESMAEEGWIHCHTHPVHPSPFPKMPSRWWPAPFRCGLRVENDDEMIELHKRMSNLVAFVMNEAIYLLTCAFLETRACLCHDSTELCA